jgi:cytochrome P450
MVLTTPPSTTPTNHVGATEAGLQPGASVGSERARVPLYTPDFVQDPHDAYRRMREQYGSMVPVDLAPGVPATLVVSHKTAVRILNDPEHFPADPRTWQKTVPQGCPVLPMMEWYPAARYNVGAAHARYRGASVAAIDGIDLASVASIVGGAALPQINKFCQDGSADVVSQYASPLILAVLNLLVGCPAEIGTRVADGMAARFDTVKAAMAMGMIKDALMELIQLKRAHPGDDVTSRLAHHPAALDDVEVFAQLMSFYGAGFEAQRNLVTNALLLMLTDERFRYGVADYGRNLPTPFALDEVLFNDPPMANFCSTYPRQPVMIDNEWLPANQPVLISLAACNNDPEVRGTDQASQLSRIGNRSHLAWSSGPHACPAKDVAYLTVQYAIDELLDVLPDMRLAARVADLVWRPGPFHRALTALPVEFPPAAPMPIP